MITFLVFLLTLGILVVFHEFGHYVVARMFKVKVITFSVGFGPKLFTFKTKSNDWCISAIPLGGYVKMLDAREGEIPVGQEHLAFNYKKPWQKILIAFAGPFFNLLFAFLAYYFMALVGVNELKPIISSVNPELVAINQVNITANSTIQKINGIAVHSWQQADKLFNQQVQKSPMVQLGVTANNKESQIDLNLTQAVKHFHDELYLETIGLYPVSYLPIIAYIEPNSPAMKAHLQINDQIISINSQQIASWFEIAKTIQNSAGETLSIQVKRQDKLLDVQVVPVSSDNDGQVVGKIGIMPTLNQKLLQEHSYTHKYNFLSAFSNAASSCYSVIVLNLSGFYAIAVGKISVNNLGGPISIAKASRGALASGIKDFVDFLALISIGLAIMNLLPIPVLDGGHILIYAIEWVIGKEVTHSMQILIFKISFVLVMGISILAIYNDILRL